MPKKPKTEAAQKPEWLDTGSEGYELSWWPAENNCPQLQSIELTRIEYVALKQHLAKMRGYAVLAAEATRA